jgi:hypothetical protein
VRNLNDHQFEVYLKRFRPLTPESLQIEMDSRHARRSFVLTATAGAAAAILLVAAFTLRPRFSPTHPAAAKSVSSVEQLVSARSLTIRDANALLVTSGSFETALDEMAFPSETTPLSKDKHSALAVLGKEKTRL